MRLLITLLAIFFAVIALGFWTNHKLGASTGELIKKIDGLSEDVKNNEWPAAVKKTEGLERAWKGQASWWPMVLDHQEMDNIEFSLAKVKEYVNSNNTDLTRGQLSELREMLRHIPDNEAVTLKNIL